MIFEDLFGFLFSYLSSDTFTSFTHPNNGRTGF